MTALPPDVYRVFRRAGQRALAGDPDVRNSAVIAAVSGGVDSMVLLRFLIWLRDRVPFDLTVAHLDHGLRTAACEDAALVAAYAARYQVPCEVRRVDVAAKAAVEKQGLEAAGRDARYAFFEALAASVNQRASHHIHAGADGTRVYIALAHHREDQAETVLLNLTRGSGLPGLCGMKRVDGNRWRPFLDLNKADILAVAEALGVPFATDSTNESADFLRNRMRHELLPFWSETAGHDMAIKLAALADHLRSEDDALLLTAGRLADAAALSDGSLAVSELQNLPAALIRRVLDLSFRHASAGRMLLAAHTDRLVQAIVKGERALTVDLPGGFRAELRHGVLAFVTG